MITLFLMLTLRLEPIVQPDVTHFTGTFMDAGYETLIRIKQVDDSLHGVIIEQIGMFPFHASISGNTLTGTLYGGNQSFALKAKKSTNGFTITLEGKQTTFFRTSTMHGLEAYDLTPYFKKVESPSVPAQQQTVVQASSPGKSGKSKYYDMLAGSQLVYYTKGSIMSSSSASSITYLNFCRNGSFNLSYDGSYSVEGDYGGNVHGASKSKNYGYWEVVMYNNQHAIKMTYANGEVGHQIINEANLQRGRWKVGNTQYALQRNKAVCQ